MRQARALARALCGVERTSSPPMRKGTQRATPSCCGAGSTPPHHLADGKAGLDDGKVAVRVRPAIVDELEVVHVGRGPVHGAARGADQQVEQPAIVLLGVQQRELVAVVHGKQVAILDLEE